MKKITIILLMALPMMLLCGCNSDGWTSEEERGKAEAQGSILVTVYTDNYLEGCIAYDVDTRVMYWISNGYYNHGTAVAMLDANGKPKLWEG